MNLTSANRGRSLELLILASQGAVILTKVPTASRRIRTPRGSTIIQVPGPCDFAGVFTGSGRGIFFDAKQSANAHRLPTGVDHFSENQRQQLLRYGEAGAISGLLAESTLHQRLFWAPWELFTTRTPSIRWAEMVPLGSSQFAIPWGKIFNGEEAVTP